MGHYFTNEELPSNIQKMSINLFGKKYSFFTDNGVFSKDGIDFGSKLLLETISIGNTGDRVLDVGCGYGVFGIIVNKMTGAKVDMVDVNKRAIHLAKRNIDENKCVDVDVFESDCYENVSDKYDTIITNPPIRAGKSKVLEILLGAKDHLNKNGSLFLVVRKEQGAKSLMEELKKTYAVEILNKKKGFYIIKCII